MFHLASAAHYLDASNCCEPFQSSEMALFYTQTSTSDLTLCNSARKSQTHAAHAGGDTLWVRLSLPLSLSRSIPILPRDLQSLTATNIIDFASSFHIALAASFFRLVRHRILS